MTILVFILLCVHIIATKVTLVHLSKRYEDPNQLTSSNPWVYVVCDLWPLYWAYRFFNLSKEKKKLPKAKARLLQRQ